MAEWLAFSTVEPFGPSREDLRAGLVASASLWAAGVESAAPEKFFPNLKERAVVEPQRPVGWRAQLAVMKALVASEGGVVVERKEP